MHAVNVEVRVLKMVVHQFTYAPTLKPYDGPPLLEAAGCSRTLPWVPDLGQLVWGYGYRGALEQRGAGCGTYQGGKKVNTKGKNKPDKFFSSRAMMLLATDSDLPTREAVQFGERKSPMVVLVRAGVLSFSSQG